MLDHIKKSLGNWTLRLLNMSGRLVPVKSVLQVMPNYMFSSMMATKSILRDMQNT